MLLLTGATGSIGSRLLPLLLESGEDVRCLVREPRRLGARRVDVQIALGDLGEMSDPYLVRQALRGVDTVIHLAATIRDQPPQRIEELNGLATVRLLRAAERSGVERFHFFSALDASAAQRTRFFRAKWLAEQAVASSPLQTTVFAPSIVYDHSDPWITLLRRFSFLPVLPVSGDGRGGVPADLGRGRGPLRGRGAGRRGAAALRAGRAGDAHLRRDVRPGQPHRRPAAAAGPRAAAAGPLRPDRAALRFRRGRVCNLGGGRADGGLDGQRARDRRRAGARSRAAKDERCPGRALDELFALARRGRRCCSPAQASAVTLVPPKPNVFLGVSDRGTTAEFNEFAALTGKHPALLQTFHPWGNSLNAAYERWRETGTRPILHISTADDQTLAELITPEQIALGAGDDYLLQLNDFFAKHGLPAYIRPLGEPNRCLNVWSAVNCDGSQKGGEHTTGWYKQAFRRIAAIVRGGQTPGRDQRDPGRNRAAAAEPDQRAEPRKPAGGAGEHHLEPAARRLAAGQGQLPRQLLAGQPLGRLGRHRLLLPVSGLERPQPLLRRQAVEGQAGRDHRVGGLRRSTNRASSNS